MKIYKQKSNKTNNSETQANLIFPKEKSNKMSMTFIFNEEKIKKDNVQIHPLKRIRNRFNKYPIKETSVGVFEGTDGDFTQFASCVFHLPDYPWFVNYIDKWYWDTIDGRENVLEGVARANNPQTYSNSVSWKETPNKMSMTFIFNEEKIKNDNIQIHPLKRIRSRFNKYPIKETSTGVFEGTDANFTQFASCVFHLPTYKWFMDYISEWYWETIDGKENVLQGVANTERKYI